MSEPQPEIRIGKFFTRSRKIPVLIGRLMDGSKIWGGPYTILQVAIGAVTIFLMWQTNNQGWWGLGILIDMPLCLGVGWAAAWASGRIPSTRRNLFNAAVSTSAGFVQSRAGIYKGKPLRIVQPKNRGRRKHKPSRHLPPEPMHAAGPPAEQSAAVSSPYPTGQQARTSLEALIAATGTREH